jgi:tetratricopeptide (TPR) repeat protein
MNPNEFALLLAWRSLPSRAVNARFFALLLWLATISLVGAAEAAPVPAVTTNVIIAEPDPQLLRSVLILQEQVRSTQRAVEQAREEAQEESKRTADAMAARLNTIEQTLNTQREQELRDLQRSTHKMIIIVGIATGAGFIAMMITGFLQMRATSKLNDASRQWAALPQPRFAELPAPGGNVSGVPVDAASANLLGAIDRLEHRLEEMEATTGGTQTATNGHKMIAPSVSASSQIATVLSKGQALNMDKPEEALEQFDEALQLEPRNIEAWIKRGTALERLQRIDEAITSYDEAISIDGSTATAYLFKAGVYNRQKKYAEALQCYEKALNAQQKSRTATPAN